MKKRGQSGYKGPVVGAARVIQTGRQAHMTRGGGQLGLTTGFLHFRALSCPNHSVRLNNPQKVKD